MSSWPFDICPDDIEYIDLRPIGLCAGHVFVTRFNLPSVF